MSNTNPARGMRDFLPADIRKRNYVINIIKEVYESYGFEPLETPSVENLETLTGKYGEEGNQLMYKILKRGEKLDVNDKELADLALRYDLTVPLARVVANYKNDLPKFFKRYQIQPVWRADRPARGRYREFYQCDVDAIGSKSMIVEAELICAVSEILQRLGFTDFIIRINHREILRGMLEGVEIAEDKQSDALIALDKLDKIGKDGVLKEFAAREINEDAGVRLLDLFTTLETAGNAQTLSHLNEFLGELETGKTAVNKLSQILELTNLENIKIDASLARGLSYYTGAIFEINVPDLTGSLGGGGRYDGLIGMFGKEEIPAVGFSLGLERILLIMDERGMFPEKLQQNSADVMVTIWNEESIGESLKLAGDLRSQGLRVLVYPEADKLGKQFKYADSIKISFVCVLGETELAENKVTLKNMQTGEQEMLLREEIIVKIASGKF
jgi:histidyl-tRNA synthetase